MERRSWAERGIDHDHNRWERISLDGRPKDKPEQIWKVTGNAFSWSAFIVYSQGTEIHTSRNAVGIDDRSISVPKIMARKVFLFLFFEQHP